MNRRPRTDNQLEFADSLQCLKHLSPEWIYSRVGLSVWIDRIDNLADDKLIEVDDLLEMSRVQAHRLGVEPKAIWRHWNGRIIAPRVTAEVISHPPTRGRRSPHALLLRPTLRTLEYKALLAALVDVSKRKRGAGRQRGIAGRP